VVYGTVGALTYEPNTDDDANCEVAGNDVTQCVTGMHENVRERVTFAERAVNNGEQFSTEVGVSPFAKIEGVVWIVKI
jgi:hypothetical protein